MSEKRDRKNIIKDLLTKEVLSILLMDRTTDKNIVWATDDYTSFDLLFQSDMEIDLTGIEYIKPRNEKEKEVQTQRSKSKAEVFTPSWVCLEQNNLVDRAWAGSKKGLSFTKPLDAKKHWDANSNKICFPNTKGKTWVDYVKANRLEITCGEAPYLTSRYDSVTGDEITVKRRIGLLDRKLRVVTENVESKQDWKNYAKIAVQSVYGFDWQGDNVFLARKNLLCDVIEYYFEFFNEALDKETVKSLAEIISWNIFQMDGLKFVIPNTCHREEGGQLSLLDGGKTEECPGCKKGNKFAHNGIYANTMDWEENKKIRFVDILKEEE